MESITAAEKDRIYYFFNLITAIRKSKKIKLNDCNFFLLRLLDILSDFLSVLFGKVDFSITVPS